VVDIFDEVDEDLRADRAADLLKRYGGLIIAAAVLIVGATGGWQAWRWWQARQDTQAGMAFTAAMTAAETGGAARDAAALPFEEIAASAPEGYRVLARLRAAAAKASSGDLPGAAVLWDQVAADTAADPLLRDLASLSWAARQIDTGDPAALEARLRPLTEPGNPWRSLAQEQLALLDLRQGKTAAARDVFTRLAADPTAPRGVRGRASALLGRLGG